MWYWCSLCLFIRNGHVLLIIIEHDLPVRRGTAVETEPALVVVVIHRLLAGADDVELRDAGQVGAAHAGPEERRLVALEAAAAGDPLVQGSAERRVHFRAAVGVGPRRGRPVVAVVVGAAVAGREGPFAGQLGEMKIFTVSLFLI